MGNGWEEGPTLCHPGTSRFVSRLAHPVYVETPEAGEDAWKSFLLPVGWEAATGSAELCPRPTGLSLDSWVVWWEVLVKVSLEDLLCVRVPLKMVGERTGNTQSKMKEEEK